MLSILLPTIAGLVLFLFAVKQLSAALTIALGDKAQMLLAKLTPNSFSSMLAGMAVTTLLDSSSAAIILTIVLVNAKILRLKQAMGIVLGANIGTTFGSQLLALNLGKFAPVLLLIGFVLQLFRPAVGRSQLGKAIFYFGLLFFALYTMEQAVAPLTASPTFMKLLAKTDNRFMGAATGAIVTIVIQSSSATIGMAMILAKQSMLSLTGSIAIMIGAELGTCFDTLLATINGSRAAIKTGIFHLLFNVSSITLGLLLFDPFVKLVVAVSPHAPVERTIANAHFLFNALGVIVFLGFIPRLEQWLNQQLPDSSKRIQ